MPFQSFNDPFVLTDLDDPLWTYLQPHSSNGVFLWHWCLLAEVVWSHLPRPEIVARDRYGANFNMKLNTHGDLNIHDRLVKHCRPGNTVAIFYPTPDLRNRPMDANLILFIPLPMCMVMRLNSDFVVYEEVYGTLTMCYGCGAVKQWWQMAKCPGCDTFWYCSKACKARSWTDKRHGTFCPALRDPNFQCMLRHQYHVTSHKQIRFVSPREDDDGIVYPRTALVQ